MTNKITIENKNQLLASKYSNDRLLYLIYGDTCKPCQELKPKLFELLDNNSNNGVVVGMISYKASKEINEYFNLKKIPYLVACVDSKIINTIQSSKMELVHPFLEKSFGVEFLKCDNTDVNEDDDFMDMDF